ncbi:MAG: bacillithiol biosynthesis deacetylase BshB1, partial [Ignavibacteriales bacterium]|nr:bacillithiol biosynthesis deacetylase BshB1 [Ignavibacteriales bacterium]
GTIAKLVRQGYNVAMADLTQGELGTRGTKEIRLKEAEAAARILGAVARRNLRIPDGDVQVNSSNKRKLISLIREFRPRTLFIPHSVDRHPDHTHTHILCKEAWFYAGLTKISTKLNGKAQVAYRPDNYFEFMQWHQFRPSFIVDISDTFDLKIKAAKAHASQFYNPRSTEPETKLSDPAFFDLLKAEAEFYGHRIGVKYGEAFFTHNLVGVGDPMQVLTRRK